MTNEQKLAIKCAYADLKGSLESYERMAYSDHDWEAHKLSIEDLENQFDFLDEEIEITDKTK